MRTLINVILNLGVHKDLSNNDIKLVKVVNFICLTWYGISLLFIINDIFFEEDLLKFIIAHISIYIMLTTVLYLQNKRFYQTAKIVFIFTSYLFFFSFAVVLDPGHLVEFYFILLLIFSILSIDNKYLHYVFLSITMFGIIGPPIILELYEDDILNSLPTKSILILCTFILIQYFKKLFIDSESNLQLQKEIAEKDNQLINSQKRELNEAYIKLEETKKHELAASNLKALKSQMNPHFIFNSINSIQALILNNETDKSYDYLVVFSTIVRNILDFSEREFISITEEVNFLKTYLGLEKLRFQKDLEYTLNINVTKNNILIPSLIIQPFIENAIKHGLMHKAGEKKLDITFFEDNNELICSIIDNGIGFEEVKKIQKRQKRRHESFSTKAIKKRLEILQEQTNSKAGYTIDTIYNIDGHVKGTKVIIILPVKLN